MMKTLLHRSLIASVILFSGWDVEGQVIPPGISSEVVNIYGDGGFRARTVFYYKPTTYDSATSPILWVMHGIGGNGAGAIGWVQNIAEQRKALIVAPNAMYMAWTYSLEWGTDTNCVDRYVMIYLTSVFKQMYRNVLQRENRDSIPVRLTGFSAGGQTVNRYMLVRQLEPDSIPIVMSMSVNPCCYVYCLDSIFGNGIQYPNGLLPKYSRMDNCHIPSPGKDTLAFEFCNDHIIQYYNENYGVLIGTADTAYSPSYFGDNRYERAQFFYNYSDTNAVTRGTTLLWQYDTVSNVGHAGWAMYNTKENVNDSFTIAERMLFDTPYHNVPKVAPVADFEADTTVVFLPNATVQFSNKSTVATSYVWDFGDTTFSTVVNPSHQYLYAGTFTVRLKASNGNGCENRARKWDYIIVNPPLGAEELGGAKYEINIYPNPAKDEFTISGNYSVPAVLELYNLVGEIVRSEKVRKNKAIIDVSKLARGLYVWHLSAGQAEFGTARGKLIVE